jgi:hypothetical protein
MKKITILNVAAGILLGVASLSANAVQPTVTGEYPGAMSLESNRTRAQVHEELMQAKAAGEVRNGEEYALPLTVTQGPSAVSREQVKAELAQWKAQGYFFNDATYPVPGRNAARQG